MREAVLDASVVIKWWRTEGERQTDEARALRASFESGKLAVVAPPLLFIEVINAFGRRWGWPEAALMELAESLRAARFDVEEPDLRSVARWTARGLTAYDSCYAALAESRGIDLVTGDEALLSTASKVARPLGQ